MKKQEMIDAWYRASEQTKKQKKNISFFLGYLMCEIEDLTGEHYYKLDEAIKDIPIK